ncbi:family protein : FeoA family protein OS=Prosthecochloris vibrioformis (strain DSM 265) GN=Cvib_0520 PE=4 SV=1: FeoA [Gemmataceae bacterium]|nr:family protein : FeoA family protein OS=Prosthecochloris vibrioformis (strain DSM 265) GN=Cvib_0520 PE=4 SV=1: FeoA [Gemmataceae bacterium]VTT99295.1 family protein : FeoA family protein OS=Prosthecochloris vibrioformis (strain DSM 265) GN=Cvib_0520 PE=4 SV=1: FeoA [Gemmataceae bacterium]
MPQLSDLTPGQRAEVVSLAGDPALVQRLYEFGLLEGETVEFLALAPLGDPIEIRLGNTRLTLRRAEAAGIAVKLV